MNSVTDRAVCAIGSSYRNCRRRVHLQVLVRRIVVTAHEHDPGEDRVSASCAVLRRFAWMRSADTGPHRPAQANRDKGGRYFRVYCLLLAAALWLA